jgi:hypothetical protein
VTLGEEIDIPFPRVALFIDVRTDADESAPEEGQARLRQVLPDFESVATGRHQARGGLVRQPLTGRLRLLKSLQTGARIGPPQYYTGRDMEISHRDLAITASEWEAFMEDCSAMPRRNSQELGARWKHSGSDQFNSHPKG